MIQTVWSVRDLADQSSLAPSLPQARTPHFLQLLAGRGLQTASEIESFLFPKRENLFDPFRMRGMREAVERVRKAARTGESVLVHGDYDADGVTGAAIVSLTLLKLGVRHETFLPERKRDGYGVSREAILEARKKGVRLLITVDCGISAEKEIREAREWGIESIVLDHHRLPPGGLPPAYAVLNPLREDCLYPFKELSAGGLAFKLAQALLGPAAFDFFDLATLSTVADMAPLCGENRILVREGLAQLSQRGRVGLRALAQAASLRAREIKAHHVGFMFGPRINASGRMSSASTALRLLLTPNEREASSLAQILEEENRQRRREEKKVLDEAVREVERSVNFARERVLVIAQEGWHAGVIGIVASRLVERYHRPALVIALDNGKGKGSGRSIRSFHLFNALDHCRELFLEFGGHEQAAGFSLKADQVPHLRRKLNEYAYENCPAESFLKSIPIDLEICLSDLTPGFVRELELLEPCGIANPKPVFLTRGLCLRTPRTERKEKQSRTQAWVSDGTLTYAAAFSERSGARCDLESAARFDLVYSVTQRRWDGEPMIVLEVKDVKPAA